MHARLLACDTAVLRLRLAAARHAAPRRGLRTTPPSCRNRILFEPHEVQRDAQGGALVSLPQSDARAEHITSVLRAAPGQQLRMGVVNGARAAAALAPGGAGGWNVRWRAADEQPPLPAPAVDLLLALPRPKVARRLWAPLAAMGVGALFVTAAARVEKSYFGNSHVADGASVRVELLRGLEQAGDTRLPPVFLARRFPPCADAAAGRRGWQGADGFGAWLVGDAQQLPPPPDLLLLAHPGGGASVTAALRDAGAAQPGALPRRILLAVGPEGGWTEHELAVLQQRDARGAAAATAAAAPGARCVLVSLGTRTLTTDTACIALLAAIKEATSSW
jgi:16S rRNA (uracil1498-N3)-methyltransferase